MIEQYRAGSVSYTESGRELHRASLLLLDGKLDEAFEILDNGADQGHFSVWFGAPYSRYVGLEKHPDFPALAAKAEASMKEQRELYRSLKATD